jgi:hypothetical protein
MSGMHVAAPNAIKQDMKYQRTAGVFIAMSMRMTCLLHMPTKVASIIAWGFAVGAILSFTVKQLKGLLIPMHILQVVSAITAFLGAPPGAISTRISFRVFYLSLLIYRSTSCTQPQ